MRQQAPIPKAVETRLAFECVLIKRAFSTWWVLVGCILFLGGIAVLILDRLLQYRLLDPMPSTVVAWSLGMSITAGQAPLIEYALLRRALRSGTVCPRCSYPLQILSHDDRLRQCTECGVIVRASVCETFASVMRVRSK